MKRVQNVAQLFIGKDIARAYADDAKINDYTDLSDGEIGIVDINGNVLDVDGTAGVDPASARYIKIVQRSGTELLWSDVIDVAQVTSYLGQSYAATGLQTDYVGFNGSSGSLDTTDSNFFRIRLEFMPTDTAGFVRNLIKEGIYKSDASATQPEIAAGLLESLISNFTRDEEVKGQVIFSRILDEAGVALGTSVDTVAFTKGSKYFTATDIDDATGAGTALAVGDYLRVPDGATKEITVTGTSGTATVTVGGLAKTATFDTNLATTAGNFVTANAAAYLDKGLVLTNPSGAILKFVASSGAAISSATIVNATGDLAGTVAYAPDLTDAVYKITALDTTNNIGTLDLPFQGDTVSLLDTDLLQIESAAAVAAEFGIKIAATAQTSSPSKFKYRVVRFNTTLDGFTATTVTESVAATDGIGTYDQVAELERQLQDNERGEYEAQVPHPTYRTDATSGVTYDMLVLEFGDSKKLTVGGSADSFKQVYIALPVDCGQGDDADTGVETILTDWLVTSWGIAGISSQDGVVN